MKLRTRDEILDVLRREIASKPQAPDRADDLAQAEHDDKLSEWERDVVQSIEGLLQEESVEWVCAECGSPEVQLDFHCWVDANDIDDTSKYELDVDAQPEKDSDKTWCLKCQSHHGVKRPDGWEG